MPVVKSSVGFSGRCTKPCFVPKPNGHPTDVVSARVIPKPNGHWTSRLIDSKPNGHWMSLDFRAEDDESIR